MTVADDAIIEAENQVNFNWARILPSHLSATHTMYALALPTYPFPIRAGGAGQGRIAVASPLARSKMRRSETVRETHGTGSIPKAPPGGQSAVKNPVRGCHFSNRVNKMAQSDQHQVFLSGRESWRVPRTLKHIKGTCTILIGTLLLTATVGAFRFSQIINDGTFVVAASVFAVFGIVISAVIASLVWAYATSRVDEVEISDRAIKYGREEFAWKSVRQVRVLGSHVCGCCSIEIKLRRGRVYPIRLDETLDWHKAVHLIHTIRNHSATNHLDIECKTLLIRK
jgi:hypothetical protein